MVRLYHRTTEDAAAFIAIDGFVDGPGITDGVSFSADPDVYGEDELGAVVFSVDLPYTLEELRGYLEIGTRNNFLSWRFPASFVNQYPRSRVPGSR